MSKKIEEITDKIEANKEVLSTMPKNNIKNMDIYQKKLEELEEEFKKYQKDISNRLQRRYQNATKKALNKEIENLETRLKTISYILELLDEEKTSYEKMGLDRAIFTLSRYYKENLENINEQIELCINSFSKVGVQVSLDDFDYSIYVKNYMRTFFQELEKGDINSDKSKEKFESSKNLTGDFELDGYSSYDAMTEFVNGTYQITDGEIISDFESQECVISSELATLNEITVGQTITLKNPNTEATYEFVVKGIYKDNSDESLEYGARIDKIINDLKKDNK